MRIFLPFLTLILFITACGQTTQIPATQTPLPPTNTPTLIPTITPLPSETATVTPTNTLESLQFFTPTLASTPTPIPEFSNVKIWRLSPINSETLLVVFVSLPPNNALIGPVKDIRVSINYSTYTCEHVAGKTYRLYCNGPTAPPTAKVVAQIFLVPGTELNPSDKEVLAWQGLLTVP